MSPRIVVRLELVPRTRDELAAACVRKGMTQLSLASRLVQWLASQPQQIQAAILRHSPKKSAREIARLVLNHMIGAKKGGRR